MQQNKEKLQDFQNSTCLRDIDEATKELDTVKKEIKAIEKECYEMLTEDIQYNMYIFEMKSKIEKEEEQIHPDLALVDPKIIDKLIREIQDILEERRTLERGHATQSQ